VEVLVGMFIISIALVAAFGTAQMSLQSSIRARDQVTAFYLAQEGFEMLKNFRDRYATTPNGPFLNTFANNCIAMIPCRIDAFVPSPVIKTCSSGTCPPLQQDDAGRYQYSDGSDTRFTRSFSIEDTDADEVKVTMTVTWQQGSRTHTFEAVNYIANWR